MPLSTADADWLDTLLRATARQTIMPSFRTLAAHQMREKSGPMDLVTDADEAAEAAITEALRAHFPGCVVVGEEAASRDPSLLGHLAGTDLAFVVDPIDGTSNFAAGLPLFGIMAAAVVRGEVAMAVIHDPLSDSSSMAVRGEGAWERAAGLGQTSLRVAAPAPLASMTGAASWRYMPVALRAHVLQRLPGVAQSFDFRCAAHQYRMLAAGKCHYMLFYKLMPWDHLPGWLLHQEAGGYAAKFDGTPLHPSDTAGGLLAAPDRESWDALRDHLLPDQVASP